MLGTMCRRWSTAFTLVFMVSITSFIPHALIARDLYAILICDTDDKTIGNSTRADYHHIRQMINDVVYHTELNLVELKFTGRKVDPSKVLSSLKQLSVKEDDIVFFYFSGHGFRSDQKESQWPSLYFSKSEKGTDMEIVTKMLAEKHPGLILAIADSCNSIIPESQTPAMVSRAITLFNRSEMISDNYKKLFLESRGLYMVSSSQPGEFSWGDANGGLYTVAFLEVLQKQVMSSESPSWEGIFDHSALSIEKLALSQTPQYAHYPY